MVSQALDFDTSFEGILGLGLPNLTANVKSERPDVDGKRQKHMRLTVYT